MLNNFTNFTNFTEFNYSNLTSLNQDNILNQNDFEQNHSMSKLYMDTGIIVGIGLSSTIFAFALYNYIKRIINREINRNLPNQNPQTSNQQNAINIHEVSASFVSLTRLINSISKNEEQEKSFEIELDEIPSNSKINHDNALNKNEEIIKDCKIEIEEEAGKNLSETDSEDEYKKPKTQLRTSSVIEIAQQCSAKLTQSNQI